jgi:biotin transport system substrate-specific component
MELGVLIVGAAAMTLTAQIQIPLEPVPITLQTLTLMVMSAYLGARLGALSQVLYLLAGASGLPVFASFKAGPAVLFGPTGGYLLAFIPAAFLIGYLAEKGWDRTLIKSVGMMLLGCLIIWTMGTLQLSLYVGGLTQAFFAGVLPFLPGDAIKIAVASGVLPGLWALFGPGLPKAG